MVHFLIIYTTSVTKMNYVEGNSHLDLLFQKTLRYEYQKVFQIILRHLDFALRKHQLLSLLMKTFI